MQHESRSLAQIPSLVGIHTHFHAGFIHKTLVKPFSWFQEGLELDRCSVLQVAAITVFGGLKCGFGSKLHQQELDRRFYSIPFTRASQFGYRCLTHSHVFQSEKGASRPGPRSFRNGGLSWNESQFIQFLCGEGHFGAFNRQPKSEKNCRIFWSLKLLSKITSLRPTPSAV